MKSCWMVYGKPMMGRQVYIPKKDDFPEDIKPGVFVSWARGHGHPEEGMGVVESFDKVSCILTLKEPEEGAVLELARKFDPEWSSIQLFIEKEKTEMTDLYAIKGAGRIEVRIENETAKTTFESLPVGAIFRYGSAMFIKSEPIPWAGPPSHSYGIYLNAKRTGSVFSISPGTIVEVPKSAILDLKF